MGYYQGCGSAYTHVAACCTAGSSSHDQNFVCAPPQWPGPKNKDYRGYDWFKTGPLPNSGFSKPDLAVNHTNSAYLIRDAAIDFIGEWLARSSAPVSQGHVRFSREKQLACRVLEPGPC
jgi:hypothetical protein